MLRDTRFQHIDVMPLTGALGADIRGVDLATASEAAFEEVRMALNVYHVVAVRGQQLTPPTYKEVASRFGTFSPNPVHASMPGLDHIIEFIREPDDTGKVIGEDWHMDLAWLQRPPGITMLYGHVVPPAHGPVRHHGRADGRGRGDLPRQCRAQRARHAARPHHHG